MEGQNSRADRNPLIGVLEIPSGKIKRDVPAGSDIEVTIEIDKYRLIRTRAFIPILEDDFEEVLALEKKLSNTIDLKKAVEAAKERLSHARKKAGETGDVAARNILQQIYGERMVHDVESALLASQGDRDAADKCAKRLLDLNLKIDELKDALAWPNLLAEAEELIRNANKVISQYGKPNDKQQLNRLEQELRQAMSSRDSDALRRHMAQLSSVYYGVLREQPDWWVGLFNYLSNVKAQMTDQVQADQWLAQGRRAINNGDVTSLKTAVNQLFELLPQAMQQEVQGYGSSVRVS